MGTSALWAQAAKQEAHGGAGQYSPSQTQQGQLLEGMGWVCAHGARKLGTGCPMEQGAGCAEDLLPQVEDEACRAGPTTGFSP